jgi:PEP-CTERM motif
MMGSKKRNSGRDIRILASACLAAAAFGVVGAKAAHADVVIDLAFANETATSAANNGGSTQATNMGITPITNYGGSAPTQVALPVQPGGGTWVAADENDAGTLWNVMQTTGVSPTANATGGNVDVTFEQDIALKDSLGNPTSATFTFQEVLPNGKSDFLHGSGSNSGTNGTDGLAPDPGSTNDGITAGSSHLLMMASGWIYQSTSESGIITIGGLTAGSQYDLYVYADGCTAGMGGTFTLASANSDVAGDTVGAVTTNTGASTWFRSVFSSNTGDNPAPEQGKSWNELVATADTNGNITFTDTNSSSVKEAIDGLQIDEVPSAPVPEPASLGLLGLSGLGLMIRRRRKVS